MIYKQLLAALPGRSNENRGRGLSFDPNFHHAVAQVESKRGAGGVKGSGRPGTEVSGPAGEPGENGDGVAGGRRGD